MPNTRCRSVVAAGATAAEPGRFSSAAAVRLADARETEAEEAIAEESGGQLEAAGDAVTRRRWSV